MGRRDLFRENVMHRIIGLAALVLSAAPCLAQIGNQNQAPGGLVPGPGALPASPQFSPSGNMPAPLPSLIDDPLRGLPDPPDPGRFSPQVRAWASMRAAGLARVGEIPDAEDMPGYLRKTGYGLLGNMGGEDIEALVFLVLMQAAKSANEDLKSIMEETKKANEARERARRQQGSEEGGLDDLGGMQKLQELMDRKSKLLSTLSNLLKKRSETEDGVVSNLK